MKDVVTMARMVPVGMDFWASLRSPERLDPAMIPAEQTVTENLEDTAHSTTSVGQEGQAVTTTACWEDGL